MDDVNDEPNSNSSRWIIVLAVLGISYGVFHFYKMPSETIIPTRPKENIITITLPPPPPPPLPPVIPPPPAVVEQPKEEMVQQEEVKPDESKPEYPKPDEPPEVTTNNVGNGPPDNFGLGGGKGGIGNGIGGGNGHKNGSKFGWYAKQLQDTISDSLKHNSKLRNSSISIIVRIWVDGAGRITKTKLNGTTGDNVLDETLKNDILNGMVLKEAPPSDMPMPIVMRITAKR